MKPLDPRLLRYARSVRGFLGLGAGLGVVQTLATVAFAFFVSRAVVAVVDGRPDELPGLLVGLAVTVLVRSALLWAMEALATRTAVRVKSELRDGVLSAATRLGGGWVARTGSARITTLTGPGLDALDDYFAKYLPQLILTALATPLLVVALFTQDILSGVIVVVTLPLIPVFMILIGWTTKAAQDHQFDRLAHLASAFLDAVSGLATLKVFGRERRQIRRIGTLTDDYRRETVKVLQVSFLSGFALEMAASLSVALVAVAIGLRLVEGGLTLSTGLFLLLLAPEAYLPLRQVGAHFHAASDGVAAAEEAAEGLPEADAAELPAGTDSPAEAPDRAAGHEPRSAPALRVRDLSASYDGRAVFTDVGFDLHPGTVTVLTGDSGAGKSTLLAALLGFVPSAGTRARPDGTPISRGDIAWAGQRPGLVAGSVAENVALGTLAGDLDPSLVESCLAQAAASDVDQSVVLGAGGDGLSGGQAQRVALARAYHRLRTGRRAVLLLDEPTSALDTETEAAVVRGIRRASDDGTAVLVVSHRPGVVAGADRVLRLESGRLREEASRQPAEPGVSHSESDLPHTDSARAAREGVRS